MIPKPKENVKMKRLRYFTVSLALILPGVITGAADSEWQELFDGKSLDGWSVHSGSAEYRVEDGVIVGKTAEGSPNSFLCTDREYGDFILEFEVQVDPRLNSGVQFRSQIADSEKVFWFRDGKGRISKHTIPQDRVYGYQAEIAESSAGKIYDEARRGFFLGEDTVSEEAENAFKSKEWNQYRIMCKGDSIKVWINEVLVTDLRDGLDSSGVIGLQVHSVPKNSPTMEVRWRNLRIQELE